MAFRRVASALLFALLVLFGAAPPLTAQRGLEYEVKAAYLYNVVNFVTWPADAFSGPADPLHVCVFGKDPFGPLLDSAMAGGTANMRPIVVDRISEAGATAKCHLIFVPGTGGDQIDQVVRAVSQRPVLTIGEASDFLRRGGMIAFMVDGGRVRFDVNLPATTRRALTLSSRLLQVARTVVGKGATG